MLNDPHYRARGYPYAIPACSYVMASGEHTLVDHDDVLAELDGRRPVLAVGSNMSPQQLARKFPKPEDGSMPVTRARLRHFDTVYSTHFSSYGAIPATLFPSPGTEVTLFINWLDPEQEARMHETEIAGGGYGFFRLDGLEIQADNAEPLDHVYVYLSCRGAFNIDGAPVPMAAAAADNRRWGALHQDEIQDHARRTLASHMDTHDFIAQNIDDPKRRGERTDALHATALPFHYAQMTAIEG